MTKTIALFDFDGTITTHDTMLELIRFSKGSLGYYTGMAFLSPMLAAVKTGMMDAQKGKEKLLAHFFAGTEINQFNALCHDFTETRLPGLLRNAALQRIREHKDQGHEVVVVSASAEQWVLPWTQKMQVGLLSSKLAEDQQIITGKLAGKNCNGEEKVSRIRQRYDLSQFDTIFGYGDSSGDRPMLQLATHPSYKPFR